MLPCVFLCVCVRVCFFVRSFVIACAFFVLLLSLLLVLLLRVSCVLCVLRFCKFCVFFFVDVLLCFPFLFLFLLISRAGALLCPSRDRSEFHRGFRWFPARGCSAFVVPLLYINSNAWATPSPLLIGVCFLSLSQTHTPTFFPRVVDCTYFAWCVVYVSCPCFRIRLS